MGTKVHKKEETSFLRDPSCPSWWLLLRAYHPGRARCQVL